ncbi:MAG: DM13 domain-containing protein [Gammaproteobacteria bacterium]
MFKSLPRITFVVLCTLLFGSKSFSETMFDAASGQLIIPVLQTGENEAYSATFSLISVDPPVWGLESATPVTDSSRTAATFQAGTGTLFVPEINVDGKLYNLEFRVSTDCETGACLEPQLESLQDLGRSGANIYTTVASTASTFTCATCHAISETDGFAADGIRRPGHPLLNATRRPHFKDGELDSLLDAVNICRTEWMNTSTWTESDQEWINLRNWLDDLATADSADPVTMDIVAPPADLSGGAEAPGRDLFNTRCVVCHGQDGLGTERGPKIAGIGLGADYIASRVRSSGRSDSAAYAGLSGGIMPFWSADRLSDGELADIIAFLGSGTVDPMDTGGGDGGGGSVPSGCTSSHPNVGLSATLTRRFHNVAGTATILDDCTIQLTNFFYDGGGIDVHVYAGNNLQFHPADGGFSLKSGLLGTAYNNGTLTITLPSGVTLDDFDSISIWCVPVGQSFGDARFIPGLPSGDDGDISGY